MEIKVAGSSIVIADDSLTMTKKLKMMLEKQGYRVYTAEDGQKGLNLIEEILPDLIILDLNMPELSGLEVCRRIKNQEKTSFTPVIILTGSSSKDDKNLCIAAGANEFLNKSYDPLELKLKVESLIKLKKAIDHLENANNIIKSLAKAVEVKDKYTEGHAERVSLFATKIAKEMQLSEIQIRDITMAGLLHDIGKIGVPDLILNKPGRLTDDEFQMIKNHPVIGEEICAPIKSFDKVKKIIRHHHEKLNGTGYPDGICTCEIGIETRIMTIADIYDAVTSDRSYRQAMNSKRAFEILYDCAEKGELDREIIQLFEGIVKT